MQAIRNSLQLAIGRARAKQQIRTDVTAGTMPLAARRIECGFDSGWWSRQILCFASTQHAE
jgi:hypothetical protein